MWTKQNEDLLVFFTGYRSEIKLNVLVRSQNKNESIKDPTITY